jgi:hypothetical protein
VADLQYESNSLWSGTFIEFLVSNIQDTNLLTELRKSRDSIEYSLIDAVHHAVYSGNRKAAAYIIDIAIKKGGWGFTQLFNDVLTLDDFSLLPAFLKVSVTKKTTIKNPFTPLHCAAINPNPMFLKSFIESIDSTTLADENMRKPIHYSAACEGPEPLKYLLSLGVDSRECDKLLMTPLMIAADTGRSENVRVLLSHPNASKPIQKTKSGWGAVHFAAQRGFLDVLKVMAEFKVTLNQPGP